MTYMIHDVYDFLNIVRTPYLCMYLLFDLICISMLYSCSLHRGTVVIEEFVACFLNRALRSLLPSLPCGTRTFRRQSCKLDVSIGFCIQAQPKGRQEATPQIQVGMGALFTLDERARKGS